MATIPELLALAIQHHQAGRLMAAEQIYQQMLTVEPNQPDAIHLLGAIAYQMGKPEIAVDYIKRAIGLKGTDSTFHNNLGNALLSQGRLDEAEACYRRALQLNSGYAVVHSNLGNVFRNRGELDEAALCYRRALELNPNYAEAINDLANVFQDQGRLDEAEACYRRALRLNPGDAVVHSNLGNALRKQKKWDEAIACCRRALELKPDLAEACFNLGVAHLDQGKLDKAITYYQQALELNPNYVEAHSALGNILLAQRKLDEAIACCRRALELKPDLAEACFNLGVAHLEQGKQDKAIAYYQQALELNPNYAEAHSALGNVLLAQRKLDEAIACCRRALELKAEHAETLNNLGVAFQFQGTLDDAVTCYRRALELKSDFAMAHSNLLYAINFCPGYDVKAIYEEHLRWNQKFAEPLAELIQPHANERSVNRRLRIGYVSPGFRENVTAVFLLPLLEAHDHERFEIFCYASVPVPDAVTDRCRANADVWRSVFDMSDEHLADIIREDRVDILVDLTMHAPNNRLLVFARKPAPVQVTYLAYAGTTGLSTMDYRLTDPYLDPPAHDEPIYREESIRLPETYWCYQPLVETPPVNALPALQTGHITFGCLNTFCKVTPPTLAAWIGLLQAMPRARLLLHADPGSHRDRVRDLFSQQGISPDRLTFAGMLPMAGYFQLYHHIDVALDPFPYGGGTTTCDALWMGVPVVSLVGQRAVGRGGLSILSNVGLAELVAYDSEQYVCVAQELAGDLPRLIQLRATLRGRMQNTPITDLPRFAQNLEAAYREMWRRWCAK